MPAVRRFEPTTAPTVARVRSARFAVLGLFTLMGFSMATLMSRMPSIRDALDTSSAQLATLIMFGALGALVGLLVTGWAAAQFGTRRVLGWANWGVLGAFSVIALSMELPSPWLFAAGYFLMSFSYSFINVGMNAEAAEVERHMGRAVMSQFHATFSIGLAAGLAIGAGASALHVAPTWHFVAAVIIMTIIRFAIIPAATMNGMPSEDSKAASIGGPFATAKQEYRNKHVILLGILICAAAMTEMTAGQWLALSVVDDFGGSEAIGAVIYWLFVVAMVTVRWLGAPIIARLGRVTVLRLSALSVIAGISIFAFSPTPWLVPLAVILWGMGAALGVPILMTAAADDPKHAAARVAAVTSFSTLAGLFVPQIVGQLGEFVPLREALLVVAIASTVTLLFAQGVRGAGQVRLRRSKRTRHATEHATVGADTGTVPPEHYDKHAPANEDASETSETSETADPTATTPGETARR
ncbi:MFS transporter [Demequina flava]|uniref:MFS transporter n=1 Tax=Demequina flava TaxID=1095025 RepID=UPI00078567AD|nr:MFS transporter [Demequina flava]